MTNTGTTTPTADELLINHARAIVQATTSPEMIATIHDFCHPSIVAMLADDPQGLYAIAHGAAAGVIDGLLFIIDQQAKTIAKLGG